MKLIIAPNYRHYQQYVVDQKLNLRDCKYVRGPEDIFGAHGPEYEVIVLPTAEWSLDARTALKIAIAYGLSVTHA